MACCSTWMPMIMDSRSSAGPEPRNVCAASTESHCSKMLTLCSSSGSADRWKSTHPGAVRAASMTARQPARYAPRCAASTRIHPETITMDRIVLQQPSSEARCRGSVPPAAGATAVSLVSPKESSEGTDPSTGRPSSQDVLRVRPGNAQLLSIQMIHSERTWSKQWPSQPTSSSTSSPS